MIYNLDATPEPVVYKLLAATTVPRPIAWVVTQDASGQHNAAPFSFFNVMGSAPPTVALGFLAGPGGLKDTARNIRDTGAFTVNLVPERLVQAMNLTAIDAPPEVDELDLAGLATLPSSQIAPPRIAESPVTYECRLLHFIETGSSQVVVIGRVVALHIEDRFLRNPERGHVDTPALELVARGFGSTYFRTTDSFELVRPKWADLSAGP